ncbi:cell wall-binding repeat-containing protein [Leifsonia sp. 22587]|uniref:cell wall-binding repeat-containing protein n=1 Tax=Leifsonia sp. 22587 TaxID=3453946 RepID=UPI003F864642
MRARRTLRPVLVVAAVVALLTGAIAVPAPAQAVSGSAFDPGYIISDYNFYNGQALSAAAVQSFLQSRVPTCRSGYTCLKDYRENTTSRAGDPMCAPYAGAAGESAATIIYRVGVACGISQRVLLILLEKEQSLVTDTWPTQGQYMKATGYACPDTSACNTKYYGFYNQVYMAAWQYKRYGNPPGTSNSFTWFPIGAVSAIRLHTTASCGSRNVLIKNAATAALYYYTPYQPNEAAMANLYGMGDACSSYGNRNFWRLYNDWFGPSTGGIPPIGSFDQASLSTSTFDVRGWSLDKSLPQTPTQVLVTYNTPAGLTSRTVVANTSRPDVGAAYPGAGDAHGFSISIPRSGNGQFYACATALATPGNGAGNTPLGCLSAFYSPAVNGLPPSSRLQGADRFATSVAVSQATYPASGVGTVYIASGTNFPDAISAAPAAAAQHAPLLLVGTTELPAAVQTELRRLAPQRVVVVGGPSAVSDSVVAQIVAIQPAVTRIFGADRFETSRKVADAVFGASTNAYLASGLSFPDALSASSAAGSAKRPVILVDGREPVLDGSTRAYLTSRPISSVTLIGGASAIPDSVQADVASLGKTTARLGAADRFQTSQQVNAAAYRSAQTAYIATGWSFPDALAGAAAAGAQSAPLFVVPGSCVPRSIGDSIVSMGIKKVVLLGGQTVLSAGTASLIPC